MIIEGISYITNYRNQVAAEIAKTSLDALIRAWRLRARSALKTMESDSKAASE